MKPSLAKGTRDFSAEEVSRRQYIINILQKNFQLFGFQPLETPSFENLSTLTGKYGEEGDRLIFKILKSGNFYNQDYLRDAKTLIYQKYRDLILEYFTSIYEMLKNKQTSKENIQKIEFNNILRGANKNKIVLSDELIRFVESGLNNSNMDYSQSLEEFLIDIDFQFQIFNKKIEVPSDSQLLTNYISDKALRYDLTVPFARFVAMNHGTLTFPFKRYQIQPVWRADRPQKGRFREFYQCDADVVGSESLWQEVELVQLYLKSFSDLNIPVTLHLNNRKILSGLAEYAGISNQLIDFTVALDKLDKIGKDGVIKELNEKGISDSAIEKLDFLFHQSQDALENILQLKDKFNGNEVGTKGVEELEFVLKNALALGVSSANLKFDITLARGLDYYTGAIFEVKANDVAMGSIGGGGRYDNLTEVFGVKNIPGIGISFGLDRIYLVMEELQLFPKDEVNAVEYLFANYGEKESLEAMKIIAQIRDNGVSAELYPEAAKLKKQFTYAEKKNIPHLVFYGDQEISEGKITIKNLNSGEQKTILISEFLQQKK